MKKIIAILLLLIMTSLSCSAMADKIEIDIEDMTPAELLALKDQIQKEYDKATYVSGNYDDMLNSLFKKTFQGMFEDAQSFSYPFFGLDTSRARTLYKISGNCTVKYYDKSKITYKASGFYYRDTEGELTLALLMLDNNIAFKDDKIIPEIIRYIDKATYSVIKDII